MTVYFKNGQWMVTDYGIEAFGAKCGPYEIEASRLTETTDRQDGTFYDWPIHMEEKIEWVDLNCFLAAFAGALAIHAGKYSPRLDPKLLERTIHAATKLRQQHTLEYPGACISRLL